MSNQITTSPADGRASKTFGVVASDNAFKVTALEPGVAGNAIELRVVVAGTGTSLSVTETGGVITVNSATNGGGTATSTADQIVDALNSDSDSNDLIVATSAVGDSNGTGVVGAISQTALTGGQEVKVSSVKTHTVITDPEDPKAVQIPPEADATGRDELAVHEETTPNEAIEAF